MRDSGQQCTPHPTVPLVEDNNKGDEDESDLEIQQITQVCQSQIVNIGRVENYSKLWYEYCKTSLLSRISPSETADIGAHRIQLSSVLLMTKRTLKNQHLKAGIQHRLVHGEWLPHAINATTDFVRNSLPSKKTLDIVARHIHLLSLWTTKTLTMNTAPRSQTQQINIWKGFVCNKWRFLCQQQY